MNQNRTASANDDPGSPEWRAWLFVSGSLAGDELAEFLTQLSRDPSLAAAVERAVMLDQDCQAAAAELWSPASTTTERPTSVLPDIHSPVAEAAHALPELESGCETQSRQGTADHRPAPDDSLQERFSSRPRHRWNLARAQVWSAAAAVLVVASLALVWSLSSPSADVGESDLASVWASQLEPPANEFTAVAEPEWMDTEDGRGDDPLFADSTFPGLIDRGVAAFPASEAVRTGEVTAEEDDDGDAWILAAAMALESSGEDWEEELAF